MSISAAGSSLPNNWQFVNWSVASFTVASGAAASPYTISNTTKTISLNSTYNTAYQGNTAIMALNQYGGYGFITTNSTDTYLLGIYYSVDNGSTFTKLLDVAQANAAQQNKTFGSMVSDAGEIDLTVSSPVTANQILLKLAVADATSPTTDAFTITNIRVTALVQIMK